MTKFTRIRDLPETEQKPFDKWLWGHTRPTIPGQTEENQDAFYQHDYDWWKLIYSSPPKIGHRMEN